MSNPLLSLVQILVVTGDPSDELFEENFKTELWIGPKEMLAKKLHLEPEDLHVPSTGVLIDPSFSRGSDPIDISTRQSARFLLQTRRLSQLVSMSWLEGEYAKGLSSTAGIDIQKNSIIRKLFLTANLEPDSYWVHLPPISGISEREEESSGDQANSAFFKLANLLLSDKEKYEYLKGVLTRIIFPQDPGWNLIRITLLFAGQVFWTKEGNRYERLHDSILSTYDICLLYAFTKVDWGRYIAEQVEMVQPGSLQKPGHFRIAMPYPPRPSTDDLTTTPDNVYSWATARLEYGGGNRFPFYPPKNEDNQGYVSTYIGNTYPPYPYIPVSTC